MPRVRQRKLNSRDSNNTPDGSEPRYYMVWTLTLELLVSSIMWHVLECFSPREGFKLVMELRKVSRLFEETVGGMIEQFLTPYPPAPHPRNLELHVRRIDSLTFLTGQFRDLFTVSLQGARARAVVSWAIYNHHCWRSLGKLTPYYYFVRYRIPNSHRVKRDQMWTSLTVNEKNAMKAELRMLKTAYLMYYNFAKTHGWDFTDAPPRIFDIILNSKNLMFTRQ